MDERASPIMKFSTKAIHVGSQPDPTTGAVMPPIFMTSTFHQEAPGETKGYDYTRGGNPNFTILEELLASLENGKYATVFSSGLGALTAIMNRLSKGDKVLGIEGMYGGTYRLFTRVFSKFGIEFICMPVAELPHIDRFLSQGIKYLFFETPTNPLLDIFDIQQLSKMAKNHGALTVVDNTFATPYFQNPLDLGADIVWHSTTKYIGGHSDVIGGAAITNDHAIKEGLDFGRMAIGLNPSPFDAWLVTRGVKTLALRMEQHQKNALQVAEFLENHPKVKKVYYPGLKSSPYYKLASQQMRGYGGMVSAEFNLSLEETKKLISSFKLFALAESLGGVESLVCHPALMTHASIPREERIKAGISDGLVRFSVGIESGDDLIADLAASLEKFH